MALEIGFYPAEFHNLETATTGKMGGAIDTSGGVISPSLDTIFPPNSSEYLGHDNNLRFQKIYIKNTGSTTIDKPRIFLENVKHVGQVSVTNAYSDMVAMTDSTATGSVTGYASPYGSQSNFIEPVGLSNAVPLSGFNGGAPGAITGIAPGSHVAFVVKQEILNDLAGEIGASATIGIVGEV